MKMKNHSGITLPMRARILRAVLPVVAAAAWIAAPNAAAQDFLSRNFIKPGEETLTLNLGGIYNQFDSSVRFNGQTQRGTDIGLEGNGLDKHLSSFFAAGTWRFLSRNRIDVEYFSAKRSGSRDYNRDITIGDTVFPIGATVSAEAKDQFLLADYRYSFVKTDSIEAAGLLGFYGGQFKFNVSATGLERPNPRSASQTSSTTVPLPMIGGSLDWYVDPQWKLSATVAGMKANIGDVDGRAFVAAAAAEYLFVRNFGIGLRYMYTDVSADVTKSDFNGNLTWRMNSVSLYAKMLF